MVAPANVTVHEMALGEEPGRGILKVPVLNGIAQHRGGSLINFE